MASVSVVERVALYDNSRTDENGRKCYRRLPWNLVTTKNPTSTFLEPVNVDPMVSQAEVKTQEILYHKVEYVDADSTFGFNENRGSGGENRAD